MLSIILSAWLLVILASCACRISRVLLLTGAGGLLSIFSLPTSIHSWSFKWFLWCDRLVIIEPSIIDLYGWMSPIIMCASLTRLVVSTQLFPTALYVFFITVPALPRHQVQCMRPRLFRLCSGLASSCQNQLLF